MGAIEAGGTKWICAIGTVAGRVIEEVVVPTRGPSETVPEVRAVFDRLQQKHGRIEGMGVGSFGPVTVERSAKNYGVVLNSPKAAWRGFDYLAALRGHFGSDFPVVIETDVNTAAFAEDRGSGTLVYVTVGTGIGGGVVKDGEIWHGRMHPEIGHIMVAESPREPKPGFSCCSFHPGCVEGKASGSAMVKRWGMAAHELSVDHEAWALEAEYLASLAVSLTAAFSPDRIVWGGGVLKFEPLLPLMREKFEAMAGGYWDLPKVRDYLQMTTLNDRAGLHGALALIARELGS